LSKRRPKDTKDKASKPRTSKDSGLGRIVIDEKKGLVFENEESLFEHFKSEIHFLEKEFFKLRPNDDIPDKDFEKYEENLALLLDTPDEVWEDTETIAGVNLTIYLKKIGKPRIKVASKAKFMAESEADDDQNDGDSDAESDSDSRAVTEAKISEADADDIDKPLYHVGIVYLVQDSPTFVYLHFPTRSEALYGKYRRGEKIYDRFDENTPVGAIEGDALFENDEFARGLYHAMLVVRGESDIREEDFLDYSKHREESIEQPDEIWRTTDSTGNVLVHFIRDLSEDGAEGLFYIVATIEDAASNSHALLFSFPTNDESLVARYRQGENLQAEEVVQEASH
jgi:hypothetical protein